MEAKEIMIGDWYHNQEWSEDLQWTIDDYVEVNTDYVEPIPLTEDILEANGFALLNDGGGDFYCYGYYFNLQVREPCNGLPEYGVDICGVYRTINYVHQLQHILRGCGFDDLADNFKLE